MSHAKIVAIGGLTQNKISEDQHKEIKDYDRNRDIQVVLGVIIAIVAALAAIAAIVAVYAGGFLVTFRKDVSNVWLTVVPFCFPVITAVGVAYRRQMSSVGVHIVLLLAVMVAGCVGYGFAIEPVFIDRFNCTKVDNSHGECHRETLVYMWITGGGIAIALSAVGVILSMMACSCAVKRRAEKNEERIREEERRFKELQEQKKEAFKLTSANVSRVPTKASFMTVPSMAHIHKPEGSSANLNGIVINIISEEVESTTPITISEEINSTPRISEEVDSTTRL